MQTLMQAIVVGVSATIVLDIWAFVLKHGFKQQTTNWSFVGRWFAHMTRGVFVHRPICNSDVVPHETKIGWTAHYVIGVAYAFMYLVMIEHIMLEPPSFVTALIFGLATVLAPWLIMQPGLGVGMFARKASDPWKKRITSLSAHGFFGAGLYVGWLLLEFMVNESSLFSNTAISAGSFISQCIGSLCG